MNSKVVSKTEQEPSMKTIQMHVHIEFQQREATPTSDTLYVCNFSPL
jgi:hypothetical protein